MQIHTIWKELSLTALQAPPVFQLEKFNQKRTTAATTRGYSANDWTRAGAQWLTVPLNQEKPHRFRRTHVHRTTS